MAYEKHTTDLRGDLASAVAAAREQFARQAGAELARQAGISEDMAWRVRQDDTLEGQVEAAYEAATVVSIVKAFADMLGSDVTGWEATADLRGIEASAAFAGLKVIVWGTTQR